MFNIKFKTIAISAYIYIILPIIIFFLTWLKWYIGIPMSIVLIFGLVVLLKKDYLNRKEEVNIPIKHFIGIAFIILIWTWMSGQGGFFYQTWDNHWRNAIFRDMINYKWPVIYPQTGNALVYYLMHWIVPALFGKIFGWTIGNIALLLWTYLGLIITYMLIVYITKANSSRKMWGIAVILITWSGLNNIGLAIMDIFGQGNYNLGSGDGWLDLVKQTDAYGYGYQYSGNDTLLSWVFNQTIVPWMAIPLILENRKVRIFAFLGLAILPYAPIPFIGFLPIFLAFAIPYFVKNIKEKNYKKIFKEIFSIPNLSAIFTIFPVFWMYYKCNSMSSVGLYVPVTAYNLRRIMILILFYLLEFGIYMLLIYKKYKKDILYYVIGITLIIIPIFRIGMGRDFCMRGSTPALFVLMIMTLKYLFDARMKDTLMHLILIIVLSIAAINPLMDYANKCRQIYSSKQFPIVSDNIKTFSDKQLVDEELKELGHFENFLNTDPQRTLFYRYLAK